MSKKDFLEKVSAYTEYAKNVDVHTMPKAGTNSGCHGVSYELAVKVAMCNYGSKGKAKAGAVDTRKAGYNVEIKSGCGELATVDADGKIISTVFKSDIVVYAPFYEPEDDVFGVSYVMTTEDFFGALEQAGLIRKKVSSAMNKKKQAGESWHYDRLAIQSYTNSKKATARWLDALEEYGMSLDEWLDSIKK